MTEIERIFLKTEDHLHRFDGKVILITGCYGFLGKTYVNYFLYLNRWLKKACAVIGVDSFIVGNIGVGIKDPNFVFINQDISLRLTIEGNVDFIIGCHGIADPTVYTRFNKEVLDGSYYGSFNLLDVAREKRAESVMLFSSSEIIGGFADSIVPTPELNMSCFPMKGERAAYDTSKLLVVVISDIYFRKYGLNIKTILPFNVYSSGMSLDDKRVISSFLSSAIKGEALRVYGKGLETRTFVHAIDFIYGSLLVLLNGVPNQHYNIGNDTPEISISDLAVMVSGITGASIEYVTAPEVYAIQPKRRCPDISLAKRDLGYKPMVSLEEGILMYWEFVKNTGKWNP